MWEELPIEQKHHYKRMILAFASLTEVFSQKAESENNVLTPILNSKYQETVFQKVFHANAEDIGNTSYDASLIGEKKKYLIGIKTFGYNSGDQKIAQFKSNHDEWTEILEQIKLNSTNADGSFKSKEEINNANEGLYLRLAKRIASLRNKRIRSSKANLQGFKITNEQNIESIYHVLMPACIDNEPLIFVGETSYDLIDEDSIEIKGCSNNKNPTNFTFKDNKHFYRFTSADSQLLMNFRNKDIVCETWEVKYADDAFAFFVELADKLYKADGIKPEDILDKIKGPNLENEITESFSWSLLNNKGELEKFSGFNGFYGVGSKLGKSEREKKIKKLTDDCSVKENVSPYIIRKINTFLLEPSKTKEEKEEKAKLRDEVMEEAKTYGDETFIENVSSLLYRPVNEMYLPIPNARRFHEENPTFFLKSGISFNKKGGIEQSRDKRQFNLIFEPSGNTITSFIAQDWGKAIESTESMGKLGEWILRGIFQLKDYEPLTAKKLKEVGINGLKLYKIKGSDEIHLQFVWIDEESKPEDYWE